MVEHSLVVPVIIRPDYSVGYEHADGLTFAHSTVLHWSPRIAREYRRDIDTLQGLLGLPVYVIGHAEAHLQPKFLALIGFTQCGTAHDTRGQEVPLYERRPPHGLTIRRRED